MKELWPGVIRSVGETSLDVNRLEKNLDLIEKEGCLVLQVHEKRAHKMRMSRTEEREHKK